MNIVGILLGIYSPTHAFTLTDAQNSKELCIRLNLVLLTWVTKGPRKWIEVASHTQLVCMKMTGRRPGSAGHGEGKGGKWLSLSLISWKTGYDFDRLYEWGDEYGIIISQKQARWLDISRGKFELSEWHAIAEEWYKAKQNRNSDESDAPCMLRKGLPRAFPGLVELKTESMKEGTLYRSRVFQSPDLLMQGECVKCVFFFGQFR